ncbi:MAG: NAD-dependent epimerase/dehydratase family protein [Alphaproteobacteria bacterium]|nr:NAD-dependent epimerase/dehydratase family protein [Alphaproteobacteria bacterium]
MKIAVTGGAGFIGTVLMEKLLSEGHEAFWLDIRSSETYPDKGENVDVTHQEALTYALKGVDAVYHLAAEHRDDVRPIQKYYDVNVGGAKCLVQACKDNGIHTIIFTSTVAVYGLDAGESSEESTPAPFNDYGTSKLESEAVFEEWAREDTARKLVTLRLVATFGPNNRGNVYTLMDQIARGRFIMIGNGENRKSVAYVGNVAAFLAHTLSFGPGIQLYNYADKPDLTMRDMVADIRSSMGMQGLGPVLPYGLGLAGGAVFDGLAKVTGRNFPISMIRVKKFCASTIVRADKIEGTGFKRPYTLSHGLQEMARVDFPAQVKAA